MLDGIKVLLIEDDTAVRIGSVQALELAGFPVESFESAERAVPQLRPVGPLIRVNRGSTKETAGKLPELASLRNCV